MERAVLPAAIGLVILGIAGVAWLAHRAQDRQRAVESRAIPLDCRFLPAGPEVSPSCPPSAPAVGALALAAQRLHVGPGRCSPDDDGPALEGELSRALAAFDVAVGSLSARERVVAQNAALRMAFCLLDGGREPPRRAEAEATQLARRLALPRAELDALAGGTTEAERWLGPRATWTERRPILQILQHEGGYGLTRAFRPLLFGQGAAALVSQLVAVDVEGTPRITSLVGEIEARTPALTTPHTACVLKLDAARLGCDDGSLRVMAAGELPPSSFVFRAGDAGVACRSCHEQGPFLTVEAKPGEEGELDRRRTALLARVAEQLELLRARHPQQP